MDLNQHKTVQAMSEERAKYFSSIDFFGLAKDFTDAASSIKELIAALEATSPDTIVGEASGEEFLDE